MSLQNQVVCVSRFADFSSILAYFILSVSSARRSPETVRPRFNHHGTTRAVSNAPDSFRQTSPVIFLTALFVSSSTVLLFFCFFDNSYNIQACATNWSRALVLLLPAEWVPGWLVLSARPPRANTHQSFLSEKLLMELEQ